MSATTTLTPATFTQAVLLSNEQCNVNAALTFSEPFSPGGWDYHKCITVISGLSCVLTFIICGFLMLGHLCSWTNPAEQRQLVRVIFTLPTFAICSLFSVWFYDAAGFLAPVPLIVESFGIVALFYFYVTCVTPHETLREQFYDNLERQRTQPITKRVKGVAKHDRGSLRWFHVTWILVFQLLLGRIATTIAAEYIEATRCPLSKRLRRGSFAISLVVAVQTALAVVAVINYERRMKAHLQAGGHRALAKLLCFKLIVLLELVQKVVFEGLGGFFVLRPTKHVSYRDLTVGTPQLLLSLEVFLFSIAFLWAYTFLPYRHAAKERPGDKRTFGRAVVDVLNIMDILKGIAFMFKIGERGTRQMQVQEPRGEPKDLGLIASTDSTLPVEHQDVQNV